MLKTLLSISLLLISGHSFTQYGWARTFGDFNSDLGYCSTTNNAGDLIVGGYFQGTIDVGHNQSGFTLNALEASPYLVKYNSSGAAVWANVWLAGEGGMNYIYSVTTDGSNVYVLGAFSGRIDLDPGLELQATSEATPGFFIAKIDNNGDQIWVKGIETPTGFFTPRQIQFAAGGHLKVSGIMSGTIDVDPGTGTTTLDAAAGFTTVFMDYTDDGDFMWAKQLSVSENFSPDVNGIAADANGNLYATGYYTEAVDFDPGLGNAASTPAAQDFYLLKLDPDGDFVWVKTLPETVGGDVEIDHSGNIIVTGSFSTTVDFDFGTGTESYTPTSGKDAFILKLDPATDFIWCNTIYGDGDQVGKCLAIGPNNKICSAGRFVTTMEIAQGAYSYSSDSPDQDEVYYLTTDSSGNYLITYTLIGTGAATVFSVSCSTANDEYMIGHYNGTADLNMNAEIYEYASAGFYDAYAIKIGEWSYAGLDKNNPNPIVVYPNPTSKNISVAGIQNEAFVVRDLQGRTLKEGILNGNEIALPELSEGQYLLCIEGRSPVSFTKH